jgi:hypothetical protein
VTEPAGLSSLEKVEAILANPAIYELGDLIPTPDLQHGGRPRDYPSWTLILWETLLSVFLSARAVEAELSHPLVWQLIRRTVRRRFPDRKALHLPARPMRRHHYLYGRDRYLTDPTVLQALAKRHRELAARQALDLGLLDPDGPGSWTHPDLSRLIYADGKVIAPLFRARPGATRLDKTTGELIARRAEHDAGLHWEGTGEAAWGTKFVLVAARTPTLRGRIILDLDWVSKPGSEAASAMACFERLAPHCPGAHGIIYDTALRGKHHQTLLRDLGWHSINKVTAKKRGNSKARRDPHEQRKEKSVHLETKTITDPDGTERRIDLYAKGGAVGIGRLLADGTLDFVPLPRIRTHRSRAKSGRYRWYNDHRLPDRAGGGQITVRLHNNADDEKRGLNRTENVRPIPPDDPDFARLYARRNDAESINRHLDDTLWLGRAHSIGHARQHVNLLGFALCVNSVALHEHRKRRDPALAA